MKTLTNILSITMIVVICACNKEKIDNSSLTGKWKLTQTLISAGGPTQWAAVPAKTNYDYVQYDSDGKLEGTVFPDYVKYAIKDSVTLIFTKNDNTQQNYRYSIKNGQLTMSPAGPILCIEGCALGFSKVGN
jgi:hypothetical protein